MARLIKIRYAESAGHYALALNPGRAVIPEGRPEREADSRVGNFEPAFATSIIQIDARFTTPVQMHAQMEPHATLAYWNDGQVIIRCSAQLLMSAKNSVANWLRIGKERVRIVTQFVGGDFAGKLPIYGDLMLSSIAARILKCSLKTAERMGIDPIELRVRNGPSQSSALNTPFSVRQHIACMQDGATRFGWSRRNAKHSAVKVGNFCPGIGIAPATRGNLLQPSKCAVKFDDQGVLTVRMAMTDIGTGSYTIFTQVAAGVMGLPMNQVRMEMGDTDFPPTPFNMKSAKSQAVGAVIWGVGAALHKYAVINSRYGYFVNHDLDEYNVPSHARARWRSLLPTKV